MIRFSQRWSMTVPGRPMTWKRTNTFKGRRITDKAMAQHQKELAWVAKSQRPADWQMNAKMVLCVRAVLPNHTAEGDVDNYAKQIQDALEGAMYNNDRQIVFLLSSKTLGTPRTAIEIGVIDGNQDSDIVDHCALVALESDIHEGIEE